MSPRVNWAMPPLPPPITSRSNARVKELRQSLSGQARRTGDLLGVEGLHLVGELHKSGHSFETLYLREGGESVIEVGWPANLRTQQWLVLSRDVFDSSVTTATPQGIAATWAIREPAPASLSPGIVLVLEDLQDPGNLGTLIRSAEAFGVGAVMVTPATANQWNPKVVRSSAGSVFRMPLVREPLQEIVAALRGKSVHIFAAVGSFIGEHVMAARHGVLTGRQPGDLSLRNGYPASRSQDTDFLQPCAILIGNEGAGLSSAARAFADEQVQIPCNAESLNAAVAGSVLMYEAMRQTTLRSWAREQGLRP